jgi:hypothetical protein
MDLTDICGHFCREEAEGGYMRREARERKKEKKTRMAPPTPRVGLTAKRPVKPALEIDDSA